MAQCIEWGMKNEEFATVTIKMFSLQCPIFNIFSTFAADKRKKGLRNEETKLIIDGSQPLGYGDGTGEV